VADRLVALASAELVRLASRREALRVTMEAFDAGRLAVDQVAVIARRVPAAYEAAACELATSATVAQLRRVVNDYPFERPEAVTVEPVERCSFHTDEGGRFHPHAEGDLVGGATVTAALEEAKDALFHSGEIDASWWDALVEVSHRFLATLSDSRCDRFRVHLHVDITDPTATIGRFTHGVGVPDSVRDRILCDATVEPVWVRDSVPIGVGRTTPVIPDRTRRIVVHRDHGRCQVPGCDRRRVEIHHIEHWEHGGATETPNLLSVCGRHHRLHHQGGLRIEGNADQPDTLVFTDASGRRLAGSGAPAPPPAQLPGPQVPYTHPTGERLQRHWVSLYPRPG